MAKMIILCFLLSLVLLMVSCSEKAGNTQFSSENGLFSFENSSIKLEFDQPLTCNIYRKSGDELLSIINAEDVPHYLVINGANNILTFDTGN